MSESLTRLCDPAHKKTVLKINCFSSVYAGCVSCSIVSCSNRFTRNVRPDQGNVYVNERSTMPRSSRKDLWACVLTCIALRCNVLYCGLLYCVDCVGGGGCTRGRVPRT